MFLYRPEDIHVSIDTYIKLFKKRERERERERRAGYVYIWPYIALPTHVRDTRAPLWR